MRSMRILSLVHIDSFFEVPEPLGLATSSLVALGALAALRRRSEGTHSC
jgi:hypothetical protein